AIEPAGTQFAMPVRLTLPLDGSLVSRFGQEHTAVKVWLREGQGWALQEATSTAEGSVTIDVRTLNTAAAGGRIIPSPQLCPLISGCLFLTRCNDPDGFCIEPLAGGADFRAENGTKLVSDGQSVYYTHTPFNGALSLARRSLSTGTITESSPVRTVHSAAYPI